MEKEATSAVIVPGLCCCVSLMGISRFERGTHSRENPERDGGRVGDPPERSAAAIRPYKERPMSRGVAQPSSSSSSELFTRI